MSFESKSSYINLIMLLTIHSNITLAHECVQKINQDVLQMSLLFQVILLTSFQYLLRLILAQAQISALVISTKMAL